MGTHLRVLLSDGYQHDRVQIKRSLCPCALDESSLSIGKVPHQSVQTAHRLCAPGSKATHLKFNSCWILVSTLAWSLCKYAKLRSAVYGAFTNGDPFFTIPCRCFYCLSTSSFFKGFINTIRKITQL